MSRNLKVCDFQKKGNIIRLFLTDTNVNNYHGDDWDDRPYEHNAGTVYEEYIKAIQDMAIPYDYTVVEASEDWHYQYNSPYSKDDFRDGKAPCLIIGKDSDYFDICFSERLGDKNCIQIYFNDDINGLESKLYAIGAVNLSYKEFTYNKKERQLYDAKGNPWSVYSY